MIANHIHDALDQVRTLQEVILEKRQFMGYSGKARILSGIAALAGAAILHTDAIPPTPHAHLIGWAVVLGIATALNYGCLLYWYLFDREVRQNPIMLKPAIDAIPALFVGAVLTAALILTGQYNLLGGCWLCLYGLAQTAYRMSLPPGIYLVGLCYLLCGAGYLVVPNTSFLNPWPVGLAFFLGELAGGLILLNHERERTRSTSSCA